MSEDYILQEQLKRFNVDEDILNWFDILEDKSISLAKKSEVALKVLVSSIPNGEIRPQQKLLIEEMVRLLDNNKDGLLQAGTGVGKSVSYLIPAILSGKKFFVTTSTIQLSSQLANKDLPMLKKYLFPDLTFANVQSFSNYICPKRVEELKEELNANAGLKLGTADKEERDTANYLSTRVKEYQSNKLKAEEFVVNNMKVDKKSLCDNFRCAGPNCVYKCKYIRNKDDEVDVTRCPVAAMMRKVKSSQVITTTHAYVSHLLRNARSKSTMGTLSDRALWIADEAHDLESYIESASSIQLHLTELRNYHHKIAEYITDETDNNVIKVFATKLPKYSMLMEGEESLQYESVDDFERDLRSLNTILNELELTWGEYKEIFRQTFNANGGRIPCESVIQFTPEELDLFSRMQMRLNEIKSKLSTLVSLSIRFVPTILKIATEMTEVVDTLIRADSFKDDYITYGRYCETKDDKGNKYEDFYIASIFLKSGEALQAGLGTLDLKKSTLTNKNEKDEISFIGVSATLKSNNSFDSMKMSLGLDKLENKECDCLDVGTVFDYQKQCLMYVPNGMPSVKDTKSHREFFQEELKKLIKASKGGALVLCTSISEMKETYNYLQLEFGDVYPVYYFSGDSKDGLTKEEAVKLFTENEDSILVGTRGFFQGLDVQGNSLRLLCIDKIPFPTPDIVNRRKSELAGQKGLNGFSLYQITPATMTLLQALGRLIRHTTDSGVVSVFDDRLFNMGLSWINPIRNSLPSAKITTNIKDVERFYKERGEL